MDVVHYRGYLDPVQNGGSMDPGSMLCPHPLLECFSSIFIINTSRQTLKILIIQVAHRKNTASYPASRGFFMAWLLEF